MPTPPTFRLALALVSLALALLPLVWAPLPLGYRVAVLALALLSVFVPSVGRALMLGACAYVGFAAAASPWMLAVAAASLVAGGLALRRRDAAGMAAMALGALVLVYAVLRRSDWPTEASFLWRAGQGLVAGWAATASVLALAGVSRVRWVGATAGLLALAGVFAARGPTVLPASRGFAGHLQGEEHSLELFAKSPVALFDLERLWAAGYGDASYLLVRVAYAQNAGPTTLRELCPKNAHLTVLDGGWSLLVEQGKQVCDSVRGWPEDGVAALATAPWAARLRADLALEAADVATAVKLYREAGEDDPWASLAGVVELLKRGRGEEAREVARTDQPEQALLLGEAASELTWAGYNALLDFATLAPGERRGLHSIDEPGSTTTVFEPTLGRRSLVTRSRYGLSFALQLPLPPESVVPQTLRFWARSVRAIRLIVSNRKGESVTYSCDGHADHKPLPPAMCRGDWEEASLPVAADLEGPLDSIVLRGDLRVARIEAVAP